VGCRAWFGQSSAPSLSVCSCLTAPTAIPLGSGRFVPGRLSPLRRSYCGRTALLTNRWPFVPHFPIGTSTLRRRLEGQPECLVPSLRRCRSSRSLAPIIKRGAASCLPFYRHPCLGSLRVVFGILPADAATFTTPGLRSGTPVRTSFVAKPPHCAFPAFGRYDPANAASASLRWPSLAAFAGWHPATGLSHAATSCRRRSAIYSGWRHRAKDCDALRVRRLVAFGSRVPSSIQDGRLRAAKLADFVSANEKRQPIGYRLNVASLRCSGWFTRY